MLVDHRDAARERVGGRGRLIWRAAKLHRAGVGRVNAEDEVAERRFAGAVFAENAMDLARRNVERDVRQGKELPEALGHSLQAKAAGQSASSRGFTFRTLQQQPLARGGGRGVWRRVRTSYHVLRIRLFASALEHGDLAGHDVLHDLLELRLLRRRLLRRRPCWRLPAPSSDRTPCSPASSCPSPFRRWHIAPDSRRR